MKKKVNLGFYTEMDINIDEQLNTIDFKRNDKLLVKSVAFKNDNGDITFTGMQKENSASVKFDFKKEDILYDALNELIIENEDFVIDNKDSKNPMEKYIKFLKLGDTISIVFGNVIQKENTPTKFEIHVSDNIDFNTKIKLINFFNDCENVLTTDFNQISINEYLNDKTEEKTYNKLVRDKIPNIMLNDYETPITRVLNDTEYKRELYKKLLEEVKEVINCNSKNEITEEVADCLEVIKSILTLNDISLESVKEIAKKKYEKKGGFEDRIYLEKSIIKKR